MSGQGEYVYASGARYVGAWLNGKFHGEGTYTDAEGKSTHATYSNGKAVNIPDAPQGTTEP